MAIRVTVKSGYNAQYLIDLAARVPIAELLPALITALGLSVIDDSGRPITYYLYYNDRCLQEEETLQSAGVQYGDLLVIYRDRARSAVKADKLVETASSPSIKKGNQAISPVETDKQLVTTGKSLSPIAESSTTIPADPAGGSLSQIPETQQALSSTSRNRFIGNALIASRAANLQLATSSFAKNNLGQLYNSSRLFSGLIQNIFRKDDFKGPGDSGILGNVAITTSDYPSMVEVFLADHYGNLLQRVKIPTRVEIAEIIPAIITRLGLRITDETGYPINYFLRHNGRRLLEQETLAAAGVRDNDTLAILPEQEHEQIVPDALAPGFQAQILLPSNIPAGLRIRPIYFRHRSMVTRIAWSSDSFMIASLSMDNAIRLWNAETGALQRTILMNITDSAHIAWSPDNTMLAVVTTDETIWLWDAKRGNHLRTLKEYPEETLNIGVSSDKGAAPTSSVVNVAWSPDGALLASSRDQTIWLWDARTGQCLQKLAEHIGTITELAWSPEGDIFASGSSDQTVRLWDTRTWQTYRVLTDHVGTINSLAWSPDGRLLASSSDDFMTQLWNTRDGCLLRVLQGHTSAVVGSTFSPDGHLFASQSYEGEVRLWRTDTWQSIADFKESFSHGWNTTLAFHPYALTIATLGEKEIHLWDIDTTILSGAIVSRSEQYVSAKVVLLGNTGAGKTGLNLVLTKKQFAPTISTHGCHISSFDTQEVELEDGHTETREIFLWDLAGQPHYRILHQLRLNKVTVALIVFDASNEVDPFEGVRYWNNALSNLQLMQEDSTLPLKKILVAARIDRGKTGIHHTRLVELLTELNIGIDEYFETSSRTGTGIAELNEAIKEMVEWKTIFPRVTATEIAIFHEIRGFLMEKRGAKNLLYTMDKLYQAFLDDRNRVASDELWKQFKVCISALERQDLIRQFSFCNLILLQPELIDCYSSALIEAVKNEPSGLGSITEERVQMADFPIEAEERLRDKGEERLLLLAVVDDMLRHEIAFRETTVDKTSILVFPSQATLEHPEMPEPEGREMVFDFVGPVLNIYATLIVRLAYCGFFTITGVWKNAATYQTQVGGTYGIFLQNFGRGEGRLTLFFQRRKETNEEMCLHFETFVQGYLESRAKKESVKRRRIFRCTNIEPSTGTICNTEIHEYRVQTYRRRNRTSLICDECGQPVSLLDGQDRLSVVLTSGTVTQEMGREADAQRERERNAAVLEYKIANNLFDVFLCHNGKDKPAVMEIGKQLKEYGILPWLDQWELRPGLPWQRLLEQQIEKINSAAVFVGENGIGPWEQEELEAFLREFTRRGCPVIPVLLPNTRTEVKLPPFLSGRTWADFRKQVPDPLDQLYWGITGKHLTRRGPA